MEIGNLIFGHSRGRHPVPRHEGYEQPLAELLEAAGLDSYGGNQDSEDGTFDNGVFAVRSYWWGDCTCGYEERWTPKDEQWCKDNKHAPQCYQTELEERSEKWKQDNNYEAIERAAFGDHGMTLMGAYEWDEAPLVIGGATVGFSGVGKPRHDLAMAAWRAVDDAFRKFEDGLYRRLCRKYKLPMRGCAVHCTCDYEAKREAWVETDDHAPDCRLVLPNFEHRASGLRVSWYKYPLRDSYMSAPLSAAEWAAVMAECRKSLPGTA